MPGSRQRSPREQPVPDSTVVMDPAFEEPTGTAEHVSDPHGTVAMLLMLFLMLLLVFLIFAIAQSV